MPTAPEILVTILSIFLAIFLILSITLAVYLIKLTRDIQNITKSSYKKLLEAQLIFSGMLPKLNNCFHALDHQVSKVCIGTPEMLLDAKAIFTTLTIQ